MRNEMQIRVWRQTNGEWYAAHNDPATGEKVAWGVTPTQAVQILFTIPKVQERLAALEPNE